MESITRLDVVVWVCNTIYLLSHLFWNWAIGKSHQYRLRGALLKPQCLHSTHDSVRSERGDGACSHEPLEPKANRNERYRQRMKGSRVVQHGNFLRPSK